jgi:chromosome partitioning protein
MAKVIAIVNQKGGVGKTTTAVNLGAGLVRKGYKVLMIDMDTQANLTMALGYKYPDELKYTVVNAMTLAMRGEPIDPKKGILVNNEKIALLPSNVRMQGFEGGLGNAVANEYLLDEFVSLARENYDYILIDCSPSLGVLTRNALVAADSVLIPVEPHYFAMQGLVVMLRMIYAIRQDTNPDLGFEGILIVRRDNRAHYKRDTVLALRKTYGNYITVYQTELPSSVRATESADLGMSLFAYQRWCKLARAYAHFVDEVVQANEH